MFQDVVQLSATVIKPAIDASCKVNGIQCNVYYKQHLEGITQITGRGNIGTNVASYLSLPDFYKKPLLIANQTKKGYKGANKSDNAKGVETVDTLTEETSYIVTYEKQHGIEWEPLMKIELFYTKGKTYPDAVYQTTRVEEIPLTNKTTVHSGLIHVYLVPMM